MKLDRFPLSIIYYTFYFLIWWYLDNLRFWSKFIPRALSLLANGFAILPMAKNLFRPYRAIHTWVAYVIGFIIRVLWIAASLALLLIASAGLLFAFFVYLGLPLLALLWLGLGHTLDQLLGLLLLVFLLVPYFFLYIRSPKKEGDFASGAGEIWDKMIKLTYSPVSAIKCLEENKRIQVMFARLGLDPLNLIQKLETDQFKAKGHNKELLSWIDLLSFARNLRVQLSHKFLDTDLLFLALVKKDRQVKNALSSFELRFEDLVEVVRWMEASERSKQSWRFWRDEYFHLWEGPDRAWVAGFLPNLKHFSTDITKLVAQGKIPRVLERKTEIERILAVLNRTTRNNVILIGPAGVGKTSIVYAVAQEMLTGYKLRKLKEKKLIALDIGGMLAGASERGELETRIRAALGEIQAGKAVLFIDEIENLMRTGFEYFLPSITAGDIQLIGATTRENYKKYIESKAVFAAQFQVVEVPEPSDNQVYPILESVANRIEKEQGVAVTFPAIEEAVKLTRRYVHDRVLPEKAIDLLDEAAVQVTSSSLRRTSNNQIVSVTPEDVAKALSQKINIPLEKITQSEADKLLQLEKILHQSIVGQDEAISAIAGALRRARAGLSLGQHPIASFLFVGPTGVGKTETVKALTKTYFGAEKNMVRLDMSEYTQKHNIARLIGAAPGFSGYEEGGQLTEAVRRRPFTVILADEFEKAHPDVLNIFLQIMGDGRLTDGQGRTVDFTNTLVIATSNAFSEMIYEYLEKSSQPSISLSYDQLKQNLLDNLQQIFRPELLNRFDDIIVFKPLNAKQQFDIARLLLKEVAAQLKEKEIDVSFTDELIEKLVEIGINIKFGARPLRRVIQEKIENPLAERILKSELKSGDGIKVGLEILNKP